MPAREHRLAPVGYALQLVGPAPLPPHERAWRHPSELAVARVVNDSGDGGGRGLVFATGLAVVMLATVMVVALAPPRSDAPSAVSATTLPAIDVQLRGAVPSAAEQPTSDDETEAVHLGRHPMSRETSLALVGAPNAVSASPSETEGLHVGHQLPESRERVFVLTESYTYVLLWSQIDQLVAPDGAIVITDSGELLASFVDGVLVILVE